MTLLLLFAALAAAEPAPSAGPCGDDVVRFCAASIPRGPEAVQRCLASRADELSGFCAAAGGAGASGPRRDATDYEAACGADVERYCAASRQGWSVTMKCLTLHNREISTACRDYGDALRRKYEAVLASRAEDDCAVDARRFCPGRTFARGLSDCLTPLRPRLGARCRRGLDTWRRVLQLRRAESLSVGGPVTPGD